MNISHNNKKALFHLIISLEDPFKMDDNDGILNFLNQIWNLKSMPSEDDRFKNAEGDIIQHTLSNDDWEINYLFEERLKLYEDEEIFNKFIETVVNPKFRNGEENILNFVLQLNEILEKDNYNFTVTEYNEDGIPIYTIKELDKDDSFPIDIKKNNIPFFVVKKPTGNSNNHFSHPKPKELPSFVLVFNSGWNDYGIYSQYYPYYYDESGKCKELVDLKIITLEGNSVDVIPDKFYNLDDRFCSLGQEIGYYEELEKILKNDFFGVLYALRDVAFFPEIQEDFETTDQFSNSLIRYNEQERLLREAVHLINNSNLENLYSFQYQFKPKFSSEAIDVNFDFSATSQIPNRIFALIGKNGTGKTQLITSLPVHISEKKGDFFSPQIPIFSKLIAVSYSIFDTFQIPKKTATFNYIYCGLRNEKGEISTDKSMLLRFHNTWKKIRKRGRIKEWRTVLINFIEEDLVDEFIIKKNQNYDISIEGFNKIRKKLSSGQSIVLYTISQIVANIRFDSLLLFDEPETHLHPNAITQLMNTINSLVEEFQSYCILATHSPLIIRECFSRNVYIMDRHENIPAIRKIGLESFGENLTILTEEVFGNKDTPKHYKKIIEDLIERGNSYEQIIRILESDNIPLSLNAKIFIKSKLNNQDA